MAEFKKLSEVEQIETASENATVLIEEEGEIKRVPKKEVGGAGGGAVVLYSVDYEDNYLFKEAALENKITFSELQELAASGAAIMVSCVNTVGDIFCYAPARCNFATGNPYAAIRTTLFDETEYTFFTSEYVPDLGPM